MVVDRSKQSQNFKFLGQNIGCPSNKNKDKTTTMLRFTTRLIVTLTTGLHIVAKFISFVLFNRTGTQ